MEAERRRGFRLSDVECFVNEAPARYAPLGENFIGRGARAAQMLGSARAEGEEEAGSL